MAGPGGLCVIRPHCAAGTDGAVLLASPTPLTLHLARIQRPDPCAVAMGKHLSVQPDMWSQLALSMPPHSGRTDFCCKLRAVTLAGSTQGGKRRQDLSFSTAPQGDGSLFLLQTVSLAQSLHLGLVGIGRFCMSCSPLGRESVFPTAD